MSVVSVQSAAASKANYVVRYVDVWKTYVTGSIEYQALRGVNLSVPRGQFVAMVGPSGSGKTTMLNLLGTLDKPTKGEIFVDDIPISTLTGSRLADFRNKKLGFIFQSFNLITYLSAEENVQMPLLTSGVSPSERAERARSILTQLGLGEQLRKRPSELSGGQQQRVAVARALITEPALILADEPTGNLDTKSSAAVASLLRDVNAARGVTIVMVTHNMEITTYCHRIVHIRDGQIEKEENLVNT